MEQVPHWLMVTVFVTDVKAFGVMESLREIRRARSASGCRARRRRLRRPGTVLVTINPSSIDGHALLSD